MLSLVYSKVNILTPPPSLPLQDPAQIPEFRRALLVWYNSAHRDLPWRRTRDPYRILVSEIMLQQTRVAAVLRYYDRFLARFPTVEALATAPEQDLLAQWAGLGYYYRARNLQKAAQQVVAQGGFPSSYEDLRKLPGVGDYTAAAVASIAFRLPHAVVDGNVLRVLSRLYDDASDVSAGPTKKRFQQLADQLCDLAEPDVYNQAVMELGATVCLPRQPQCLLCPVASFCAARMHGTQDQRPVKSKRLQFVDLERTLLMIERRGKILFRQRSADKSLMPGFFELPDAEGLPTATVSEEIGKVRHTITHHNYTFVIRRGFIKRAPREYCWFSVKELENRPITTVTRKALALFAGRMEGIRVQGQT